MTESIVSGVAARLGNSFIQEANFLSGVSTQVELLKTELKQMQGLLKDADAKQDESAAVRQWVADIRDLAYDAEDVIVTYELKVGSRKGGGLQKFIKILCACILCEGITAHNVGSEIENIRMKITDLKTNFPGFSIRESIIRGGSSSSNEREQELRQTFSHLDHEVVGFDDDLNKLVEFLLRDEEGNRVASIYGMGGLGKTTLAKLVYNHPEVKEHFDCRSWSYISQQCQRRRIWEEILIKLLSLTKEERDGIQKLTEQEIVEKLREVQLEKKCLVILDDIWDIETWNSLRDAFPLRNIGGKILLTSRNKEVSLHVDTEAFLHELQCLNKARSWELLEKIAISGRKDLVTNANMPYIEKLGKGMIEHCNGLPLAITVLGGVLVTKTLDEWADVLKHIKSYIFNVDLTTKVLCLSYNDLPFHLKPCFLYLGHFLEDIEISTKELIQMWMGEGFIWQISHEEDGVGAMEYKGEQYLRELVQRCMVQVGEVSKLGTIETCRIHDLMRDFCISKAQQENFLQITKKNINSMEGSQWHIGKTRRLAITLESNDNYPKGIEFIEYPYLRSLLYFVPHEKFYFKKSKLLRVLNMKNYEGTNLPNDIGRFIHLRFLSLENSNINEVPSSIGNLRCLLTLDLRLKHYRVRVPNVFKKMEQLRHLYLPYDYRVSEKLELGNLHLQTLLNVGPETIKMPDGFKLNHLQILHIQCQVCDEGPRLVQTLVSSCPGIVRFLHNLRIDCQVCDERPHLVQTLVSSCPNINVLYVRYHIKEPLNTCQFSQELAELNLSRTHLEVDPMPTLGKLPNLKILRLFYMSFLGNVMVCSEGGFPLLKYLLLKGLDKLGEWEVKEGAMPSLCHLTISCLDNLKTIPDGLKFVTTLRELKIKHMSNFGLDKGGPDFYKVQHVQYLVFEGCDDQRIRGPLPATAVVNSSPFHRQWGIPESWISSRDLV